MLNIAAFLVAGLALLFALPALFPLLGWANWFILPLGVIAIVLGQLSRRTSGRNFAIVVTLIIIGRLALGGGIL